MCSRQGVRFAFSDASYPRIHLILSQPSWLIDQSNLLIEVMNLPARMRFFHPPESEHWPFNPRLVESNPSASVRLLPESVLASLFHLYAKDLTAWQVDTPVESVSMTVVEIDRQAMEFDRTTSKLHGQHIACFTFRPRHFALRFFRRRRIRRPHFIFGFAADPAGPTGGMTGTERSSSRTKI